MTSSPSTPAISSPGLADGHTPSSSPAGLQLDLFGQPLCPASPSARPASRKAKKTKGTSGPCSFGSSASASLQSSLASRLIQMTDIAGSPEYVMTWKRRATLSGAPICRLAARPRPTSEAAFSGWATPAARDGKGANALPYYARAGDEAESEDQLPNQVIHLVPGGAPVWVPCPCCESYQCTTHRTHAYECPCPPREEWESTPYHASGTPTTFSDAETAGRAGLAPEFSLWLMGYPAGWVNCAPQATRSFRR